MVARRSPVSETVVVSRLAAEPVERGAAVDGIEAFGEYIEIVGVEVAVPAERHLGAAVAELRLDCFDRRARGDEETGAGVTQDVDARALDAGLVERGMPLAGDEVAVGDVVAARRGEDERV